MVNLSRSGKGDTTKFATETVLAHEAVFVGAAPAIIAPRRALRVRSAGSPDLIASLYCFRGPSSVIGTGPANCAAALRSKEASY
jgi:hypothetical protein